MAGAQSGHGGGDNGIDTEESLTESQRKSAREANIVVENLLRLSVDWRKEREFNREAQSTIKAASDYSNGQLAALSTAFKSEWSGYLEKNSELIVATKKSQRQVWIPLMMVEVSESGQEPAVIPQIVADLLTSTDFPAKLERELSVILGRSVEFSRDDGKTIMAELRRLAPELRQRQEESLPAQIPAEIRDYLKDDGRAFALTSIVRDYYQSWNGRMMEISGKMAEMTQKLDRHLSAFPTTSETRIRLATKMKRALLPE